MRRFAGVALAAVVVALALAAALVPWLAPGTMAGRDVRQLAAGAVFVASYLSLAIGRIPGLAIDRAGVALVGACLMVVARRSDGESI